MDKITPKASYSQNVQKEEPEEYIMEASEGAIPEIFGNVSRSFGNHHLAPKKEPIKGHVYQIKHPFISKKNLLSQVGTTAAKYMLYILTLGLALLLKKIISRSIYPAQIKAEEVQENERILEQDYRGEKFTITAPDGARIHGMRFDEASHKTLIIACSREFPYQKKGVETIEEIRKNPHYKDHSLVFINSRGIQDPSESADVEKVPLDLFSAFEYENSAYGKKIQNISFYAPEFSAYFAIEAADLVMQKHGVRPGVDERAPVTSKRAEVEAFQQKENKNVLKVTSLFWKAFFSSQKP